MTCVIRNKTKKKRKTKKTDGKLYTTGRRERNLHGSKQQIRIPKTEYEALTFQERKVQIKSNPQRDRKTVK